MTYFGFLAVFLLPPLVIWFILTLYDLSRGRTLPSEFLGYSPSKVILVLIILALVYTTPWDNYLVATQVWWYNPNLVTDITLGWVPIEEYIFFILQTALTGLWTIALIRHLNLPRYSFTAKKLKGIIAPMALLPVWLYAVILLVFDWGPGACFGLLLSWALPPIALQLAFGADILWHYRKLVAASILTLTLFLPLGDALAIGSGTWKITRNASFV